MRKLVLALAVGVATLSLAGCGKDNMGQSDTDIAKQTENWKNYNEQKAKETPLPPGDGPSN
ncbi:MAG: hypothetical protein JST30_13715 [Armatimonadetes bacterium]|nr:hypothetical protein [Armatimonadota bacterium]